VTDQVKTPGPGDPVPEEQTPEPIDGVQDLDTAEEEEEEDE